MIPTVLQSRILRTLKALHCLNLPQLKWLMRLETGASSPQTLKALQQLQQFHEIYLDEGAYHLPGRRVDNDMVQALWVMRKVAEGDPPLYAEGKPPVKLCFQLGTSYYLVIPTPPGRERIIQAQVETEAVMGEQLFYFLRSPKQIPLMRSSERTYLVLPDKRSVCVFLKPDSR